MLLSAMQFEWDAQRKFYLHAILDFGHDGILGDKCEEATLPGEGQRDDERRKERHLEYQEGKNLSAC